MPAARRSALLTAFWELQRRVYWLSGAGKGQDLWEFKSFA